MVKYAPATRNAAFQEVIKKYSERLGFLLQESGWTNLQKQKSDVNDGGFYINVPLDNKKNLDNLKQLSNSIDFYNSPLPDMNTIINSQMVLQKLQRDNQR